MCCKLDPWTTKEQATVEDSETREVLCIYLLDWGVIILRQVHWYMWRSGDAAWLETLGSTAGQRAAFWHDGEERLIATLWFFIEYCTVTLFCKHSSKSVTIKTTWLPCQMPRNWDCCQPTRRRLIWIFRALFATWIISQRHYILAN